MTANEVLTSLFWIVLMGYVVFLGWFVGRWVRSAPGRTDKQHRTEDEGRPPRTPSHR